MLVQAHLEKRAGEWIKEHAELIAEHHGKVYDHERMLQRIERALAEATDKINFLIDREMKREGGPESHV
jgi:hypothetical protein